MSKSHTLDPSTHQSGRRNQTESQTDEPTISDVATDAMESFRRYAVRRPEVVAMWCLGIGFVLGWKLKPW